MVDVSVGVNEDPFGGETLGTMTREGTAVVEMAAHAATARVAGGHFEHPRQNYGGLARWAQPVNIPDWKILWIAR